MNCNLCRGVLMCLGVLGKLVWLRCRDCGMDHSMTSDEFDAWILS